MYGLKTNNPAPNKISVFAQQEGHIKSYTLFAMYEKMEHPNFSNLRIEDATGLHECF